MSSVTAEHPAIASLDDNGTERITVFDDDTSVICGAFRPVGHLYWRLYLATGVATAGCTATQTPPPHLLAARREDACRWVELIAHLYTNPGRSRWLSRLACPPPRRGPAPEALCDRSGIAAIGRCAAD